ncbi:MAG: AbrB family transcriptional regulator [Mesorhizobium sp.]|nr:AbrB family transcriptional regulator [Mesorhizobium sp.]MBL8576993.1 AbrB family transcriptional regulator [Mesorhizobium sp.]
MDALPPDRQRLGTWPAAAQCTALLAVSAIFVALLDLTALPAAFLIGPMFAAIIAGTNGATVRIPRPLFGAAQAIVGCLVAASISIEIVAAFTSDWLLVTAVVVATLAASSFLGWFISRFKVFPGSTAVWGSAPGGATAMVLMAGAFGADVRLVAFMQYLRVIMVSVAAALVARLWVDTSGVALPAHIWFPAIQWPAFGAMIAIAAVGAVLGRIARLPSPYFLGAAILGAIAHIGFGVPIQLPEWLLAASYALIGWTIGLNFTSGILLHAARALPQIVGSILALMAFCGGLAWLLSHQLGIDPLTAYLATSPGGLDSVAIIAAASKGVDMSFVMALQSCRLVFVLAFGPFLARLVSRWVRE